MVSTLAGRHILLIVTGGIAAYKSLELVREIQKRGGSVQTILTPAALEFVTPLSFATLSGRPALTELFDLTREAEIGHIELSRSADLIVVAPASADFLAKMAHGLANDLASTTVLATDTDILVAPAMNVRMWQAAANQRNIATLQTDGVQFIGPETGDMACGEFGPGRMSEPSKIAGAIATYFAVLPAGELSGRHILVTSGPTREWIDPVRYFSNASSGKQGSAIAAALRDCGARVTFVTGPAEAPRPAGCEIVEVETAREMRDAVHAALPADAAIFCAAVADWSVANASDLKLKKSDLGGALTLQLVENPDILFEVSHLAPGDRPKLVVGFAAETGDLAEKARQKLERKGCDWILANDVSPGTNIFGGDMNQILAVGVSDTQDWGRLSKKQAGARLAKLLTQHFIRNE